MAGLFWTSGNSSNSLSHYRKSPGGVFLALVKKAATKEQRDNIFKYDRQRKSVKKKEYKKRKARENKLRKQKEAQDSAANTSSINGTSNSLSIYAISHLLF